MAERLGGIREGWRLGAAIALLTGGFWYEAHAVDEAVHGNTGASAEYTIEGAILLGAGTLTYMNHNRHMERVRGTTTSNSIPDAEEEQGLELQERETLFLGGPEAHQ